MRLKIPAKNIPLVATAAVCIALYTAAALQYENFGSGQVFINFLAGNSFLGIAAFGLTFVILSGGIDLSVGAVIGATSICVATLIQNKGMSPWAAGGCMLAAGTALGATMGWIIHFCKLPAFLVTLAGMFLARGIGFVVSMESVSIEHALYSKASDFAVAFTEDASMNLPAVILLVVFVVATAIAHFSSFGRNIYALGGNENASLLMGLPVARTKLGVYAMSGFCAALAGIVHTIDGAAGNASAGLGLELDAIAAVVIGGTLLTGGVGTVMGTLLGLLIFGIIQTAITFDGTLNSWWTKIAIAGLLLCFIILQKLLSRIGAR
jgi:ribose/xylose/arabinose/galactoside ABC-type transport system permease subunit